MEIINTIKKIAPIIGDIISNSNHNGFNILNNIIGTHNHNEICEKIEKMSVFDLQNLEERTSSELEQQKITLEEHKITRDLTISSLNDRKNARKYFAKNEYVMIFGMLMSFFGFTTIVFFSYKSLFIEDSNLHFIREVKAFIEGSLVSIIMQYFFGNAHKNS